MGTAMTDEPLPLPVVDPYSMLPEPEEFITHPAPVLTSLEAAAMGWEWWIQPALTLEKRAKLAGWECRLAFARGYRTGRARGTFVLWDTVGAWLWKADRPRMMFRWERTPDLLGGWKADTVLIWSGGNVISMGHTAGKALL